MIHDAVQWRIQEDEGDAFPYQHTTIFAHEKYRQYVVVLLRAYLEHMALFPLTKYQVPWNCGGEGEVGTLHVLSSIAGFIVVYCRSC